MSTMGTFAIFLGGTVVYLLVICMTCAVLFKTNPFGECDVNNRFDRQFVWMMGAIWPIFIPVGLFLLILVKGFGPGLTKLATLMTTIVDWAIKERPKKVGLPKMQVHK